MNRRNRTTERPVRYAAAVTILALLSGLACSGRGVPPETGPEAQPTADSRLRPGDIVRVEIWGEPDLSGEFMVNRDGIVVFPLLGERRITGVSLEALQEQLVLDYQEFLESPLVSMTALRRISILGEVGRPGLYTVDPTMSLTETLALAGGVASSGNMNDIRVVRDGRVLRLSLDATLAVSSTPIRSGDQIVVGQRSWLSRNVGLVLSVVGLTSGIIITIAR